MKTSQLKIECVLRAKHTLVEDEVYAALKCPVYDDLRRTRLIEAGTLRNTLNMLSDTKNLQCYLIRNELILLCAKTCFLYSTTTKMALIQIICFFTF